MNTEVMENAVSTAIVAYDNGGGVPARLDRDPEVVLAEAQKAAAALKRVVEAKPKKVIFNGKQYLEFADWQTIGRFYNATAKVKAVRPVSFELSEDVKITGFEADAVVLRNGEEIGGASAMCLSDEPNWASKPIFQQSSMAQTRAQAKALRSVLGWVVELAGYASTPAEEMTGTEGFQNTTTVKMPQKKTAAPKAAQPAAPAGAVEVLVNFKVVAIEEKEGATWHLYKVVADTGLELSTFNNDFGVVLKTAHSTGAKLTATYVHEESKKKPGVFNNVIKTLEGAEEAAAASQATLGL